MTVTNASGNSLFSPSIYDSLIPTPPIKRRVFISYHHFDQVEAQRFVDTFAGPQGVFTYRGLGLSLEEDLVNSSNTEYVMRCIRERHLGDSTVTIVLLGRCTHGRRYVDWELKSSIQQGDSMPNGVLGILLPSAHRPNSLLYREFPHLPPRFQDNWAGAGSACYASYYAYPSSPEQLRGWIEAAWSSRTTKNNLIRNGREIMRNNRCCLECGVTH
jgi:hypothetical protein